LVFFRVGAKGLKDECAGNRRVLVYMVASALSNQSEPHAFHEMNKITKRDSVTIADPIERSLVSIR